MGNFVLAFPDRIVLYICNHLRLDVKLRIESSSGVPITRQIADQIRAQCAGGEVRPGERLPSVRELARELAVNQNTILRVYEKLTTEGLLERRHGAGTYVSHDLPGGQLRAQRQMLREDLRRLVRRARMLDVDSADLHDLLDRAYSATDEPTTLEKRS
jgi:GntR family transcriptional regulator